MKLGGHGAENPVTKDGLEECWALYLTQRPQVQGIMDRRSSSAKESADCLNACVKRDRTWIRPKLPSKPSYGDRCPVKEMSSEGECILTKGVFSNRDEQ